MNKKKLKIIHLTSAHPRNDTRVFVKMCSSLANQGHDVSLIVADGLGDEIKSGVKIFDVGVAKNRFYRIFFTTLKVYKMAIKQNVEVYHFHDPELLLISWLLKLFSRSEIIYDVHENIKKDILGKVWLPLYSRKIIAFLFVLIEKLALKFIDYIIIAEDSYVENYKNRNNVVPVRNYPIIGLRNKNITIKKIKDDPQLNILYVGGVTKIRGAIELIKSLNFLLLAGYKNIKLKLIGPISINFKNELFELINKYKLNSYVSIPGVISHEKVYDELERAHIGLSILHPDPNFVESIPTKLYEYMSVGIPVIASNFPLWRDIVEGNNCGICVDPMNPYQIAEAMTFLKENPKEAKTMGDNGRKAVLEKYNWKSEEKKLIDLYNTL